MSNTNLHPANVIRRLEGDERAELFVLDAPRLQEEAGNALDRSF